MSALPRELVDMVIDQLAGYPEPLGQFEPFERVVNISGYSTISRKWLDRAQKHHFKVVHFGGQDDLEKWRAAIEADHCGVSRHVRKLLCERLNTLEGFDDHIRAFKHVEEVEAKGGGIFCSISVVNSLALLGSSLVKLEIDGAPTTPHVMASLLAALPRLRQLRVHQLEVKCDGNTTEFPSNIPFFEGANALDLRLMDYLPGTLDWIPPTAQFRELRIYASCVYNHPALVNQWIASSGSTLECLATQWDLWDFPSIALDLSGCTTLKTLELAIPIIQPGEVADVVLSSLSSPQLSKVVLELSGPWNGQIDSRAWEMIDGHLCRLAKQFKAMQGGKMMEVSVSGWFLASMPEVLERLKQGLLMPNLGNEVNIGILDRRF